MIGIYFLKQKDEVVYVGQSINIHRRIEQHKDKKFDNYSYIQCSKDMLNCTEEAYILRFNPIYNKRKAELTIGCDSLKEKSKLLKYKKEMKEWKHLRVKLSTHTKIKVLVGFKGMKVDEVINYLIEKENNKGTKNVTDYRRK